MMPDEDFHLGWPVRVFEFIQIMALVEDVRCSQYEGLEVTNVICARSLQ